MASVVGGHEVVILLDQPVMYKGKLHVAVELEVAENMLSCYEYDARVVWIK